MCAVSTLGDNIRRRRVELFGERGQRTAATKFGYKGAQTWGAWERGEQRVSAENLAKLAKFLGLSPRELDPKGEAYRKDAERSRPAKPYSEDKAKVNVDSAAPVEPTSPSHPSDGEEGSHTARSNAEAVVLSLVRDAWDRLGDAGMDDIRRAITEIIDRPKARRHPGGGSR